MAEQYTCTKCKHLFNSEENADNKPCPRCGATQTVMKSSDFIQGVRDLADSAIKKEKQGSMVGCIVLLIIAVVIGIILWFVLK